MTSPIYIGVSGRAGSGKDPAAQVLAAFTDGPTGILALSTGLKEMLAARYGVVPTSPLLQTAAGKASPSPNPLQEGNTVRNDLQQLGDKTRELDPQIWIRDMQRRAEQQELQYVIIPDIRYPNELAQTDLCIWVGPDTEGEHQTENALNSHDFPQDLQFMQPEVWERLQAIRQVGEKIVRQAKMQRVVQSDDWSDLTLTQVIDQLEREDQLEELEFNVLDDREVEFEPEDLPTVVSGRKLRDWDFEDLSDGTTRVWMHVRDLRLPDQPQPVKTHLADVRGKLVIGAGPFKGLIQHRTDETDLATIKTIRNWLMGRADEPGVGLGGADTSSASDNHLHHRTRDYVLSLPVRPGYTPLGSPVYSESQGWLQALVLNEAEVQNVEGRLSDLANQWRAESLHQLERLLQKYAPEFTDGGRLHRPDEPVPCSAFSWVEVRPFPLEGRVDWLELRADGLSWAFQWQWRYAVRPKLTGGPA